MNQFEPRQIVVDIKDTSKSFIKENKKKDSIRGRVLSIFTSNNKEKSKYLKALDDINLSIYKNEFFGIIGRNGSGKSTLLKLIIGTYKPDQGGIIKTTGKIIRLALGLGFDPNLSARDNIYVNGSILGLSFKEIGNIFHEIIEFGELTEFIDTPIKHYSSGMRTKLAFSVAMHANSDILLIDEFFGGVGDISFREKSNKVFRDIVLKDKTIIFVSHNTNLIKRYCDRVGLLDKGKLVMVDTPDNVIKYYIEKFEK